MNNNSCGVIVGRFQVARLHDGHRDLIDFVISKHANVLIVLGVSRAYANERNPLSYEMRKTMIRNVYPDVQFAELKDGRFDSHWCKALDRLIEEKANELDITMYGSRDSFLDSYTGKFPVERFSAKNRYNGTSKRMDQLRNPKFTQGFREGVIYSVANRAPIVYPTVDVAVLDSSQNNVLLAGKNGDGGKLRFIGGFVDAADKSYEMAARREVYEETSGAEVSNYSCLGSFQVDDWRYRGLGDGIMTTFYCAKYIFGCPRAADDIDRLTWVPIRVLLKVIIDEHKPLAEKLLEEISRSERFGQ